MSDVLGISLGTRALGIAVLKDGRLTDWKIQSFPGQWSLRKQKAILHTIEQLLRTNQIRQIAIKIPDTLPSSKAFFQLIGGLNVFFEDKDISVVYYTLSDIKEFHCPKEEITKSQLMDCIVLKYPELIRLYRKEQHSRKSYYTKIFEAVGAANLGYAQYLPK